MWNFTKRIIFKISPTFQKGECFFFVVFILGKGEKEQNKQTKKAHSLRNFQAIFYDLKALIVERLHLSLQNPNSEPIEIHPF